MAKRVAGGQRDHRFAGIPGGQHPARHLPELAIHVDQFGRWRKVTADQRQRAAGPDDDISAGQSLAGAVGKPGPAVVENAKEANWQGAVFRGFHLLPVDK